MNYSTKIDFIMYDYYLSNYFFDFINNHLPKFWHKAYFIIILDTIHLFLKLIKSEKVKLG